MPLTMPELTNIRVAASLREKLRDSACARFSTVLGNGADAYQGAKRTAVRHPSLVAGDACPACRQGTVYDKAPGVLVRIVGQPPLGATIYELQKLRCHLCGEVFTAPAPVFQPSSITPFKVGSPDDGATGLVPFPEQMLVNASTSRTPLTSVPGLTQDVMNNPNSLLQNAIAGQNITQTTVLIIASDPTLLLPPGGPLPAHAAAGGGIADIDFLSGGVSTGFNANVMSTTATFWIETILNADGTQFLQLQYTQRVLLVFNGLVWPHVSVATLT